MHTCAEAGKEAKACARICALRLRLSSETVGFIFENRTLLGKLELRNSLKTECGLQRICKKNLAKLSTNLCNVHTVT